MTRVAVLVPVVAVLFLGASASGAPEWGIPVQISIGERALGPELVVGSAGDAAVVWDHEVGPDCADSPASLTCAHVVELTTRSRGTSAWGAPVELGRPGIGDRPRVALNDAGDAVVAWVHDIGRDRVLQATFWSKSAATWPEPNDISEPSLGVQDFRIGLDSDGNAIAAWAERTETGVAVRVATRSAAAGGWGAAKTLSKPGGNVSGGPSLALTPGGIVVVVWIEDDAVWEIDGLIRSGYWGAPFRASSSESGVAFGAPEVAIDQVTGDIIAAWASRTPLACCGVQIAFYSNARQGWERTGIASDIRLPFDSPQVGAGNGSAIVLWVSGFGITAASHSRAGAWSNPTLISNRSANAADPDVALDPRGNAVAVWVSGAQSTVQATIRPGTSGVWQPAVTLSESVGSRPLVALDGTSRAVTAWNRTSSRRVVVESVDLTPRGPILSHLTVPSRAIVVGARARFSVVPDAWSAVLVGQPRWRFGDGGSASGETVVHAYVRAGRYDVTVSQADAAGRTSTSATAVDIVAPARNLQRPTIEGTPRVGHTLTCSHGGWTGSPPIRYAYSWRRSRARIPGRTAPRYTLVRRDAGSVIKCEVVATNRAGSVRAASAGVSVEP